MGISGGEADMVFDNSLLTSLALEVLSSLAAMAFGVILGLCVGQEPLHQGDTVGAKLSCLSG